MANFLLFSRSDDRAAVFLGSRFVGGVWDRSGGVPHGRDSGIVMGWGFLLLSFQRADVLIVSLVSSC